MFFWHLGNADFLGLELWLRLKFEMWLPWNLKYLQGGIGIWKLEHTVSLKFEMHGILGIWNIEFFGNWNTGFTRNLKFGIYSSCGIWNIDFFEICNTEFKFKIWNIEFFWNLEQSFFKFGTESSLGNFEIWNTEIFRNLE